MNLNDLPARLPLPYEYVADEIDTTVAGSREITDPSVAADMLVDYLERRLTALSAVSPEPMGFMLSAGIDSLLVGAVARSIGLRPTAVTVVASDGHSTDGPGAVAAAETLGLDHELLVMDSATLMREVGHCIRSLRTDEVWEVMSAVPIRAAVENLKTRGATGLVLTGTGADAIFAGGKHLEAPDLSSRSACDELDEITQREVGNNFRRDRLIPDFYELLLGSSSERFVMLFQTREGWELSQRFAPSVLWTTRANVSYDKSCLRLAASRLGLSDELVWTSKDPLQRSSGLVSALEHSAREIMAQHPGATTYTDPRTEDSDLFIARMALRFHSSLFADLAIAPAKD